MGQPMMAKLAALRPAPLPEVGAVRRAPYGVAVARTRLYRDGKLVLEDFPAADISEYIGQPGTYVWLDYCAPTAAELATVTEELKLHPLAVEDAVNEHQRPKLDRYDTHLFMSAYNVHLDIASGELRTSELGAFITKHALVTIRKDEGAPIDSVVARWDGSQELAGHGVAFLLWGLLDDIVDGHFDAVQSLDTEIENLEDLLFADVPRNHEVQRRSFELRKSLVLLRRIVLPMREVVNAMMRRDLHVVDEQIVLYYQDVYDHVLRATEWTESLRDLVTTILETNLTIQGNQMNLVMKKVTSWAAIIAVPTAITGFYGQNVPYPGFSTHWGFWFSTLLIIALSVALYWAFRRRDWI
jgi:magnesium transporter